MPNVSVKTNAAGGGAFIGGAKKAAPGAKKSKLYKRPEKIQEGVILRDLMKTEWKIGPSIGTGGFGEIYSASRKGDSKYDYVVKCEPHGNGPLFVEMHFYMRNARLDDINKFQKERGIKNLGMPHMIGNGSANINGIKHRFIVMPRYGSDVAKHFIANGRQLPEGTCYRLALQMLDVYEYIHCCGYVHGDLKAANILLGYGKQRHQAYLVDFGLASHFTTKDFKPDPKKMHNGTLEYTSRDAHHGVSTMRADLEILGYNLIEWLGTDLPWVKDKLLTSPVKVQKAKENFMSNVEENLNKLFAKCAPTALSEFFKYVAEMEYNETPDYEKCRKIFISALKRLEVSLTGDLDFKLKAVKGTNNISSSLTSKMLKTPTKKKSQKHIFASEDERESEDETKNASEDDDNDVFLDQKKSVEKKTKKLLKPSTKLSPIRKNRAKTSLKRTMNDSSNSELSPSPSKRIKSKTIKSPTRKKISTPIQNSPLKTTLSSSSSKSQYTPLISKPNVRMSPVVSMSSSRSGKTIINDRITPNKKPSKTYEFNFELDVSMDANVIVNVKRKKKPLQPSQELQNSSSKSNSAGKTSSTTSNSTPVTKVKVRKVDSGAKDGTESPRTPAVTVKKSRRIQHIST